MASPIKALAALKDFTGSECEKLDDALARARTEMYMVSDRDTTYDTEFVTAFQRIWTHFFPLAEPEGIVKERLGTAASIMCSMTDTQESVCEQCLISKIHVDLFASLNDAKMHTDDFIELRINVLGTVWNIEQRCDTVESYRTCNPLPALGKLFDISDMLTQCFAHMLTACIITEDENKLLNKGDTTIKFLVKILKTAVDNTFDQRSHGFRADEIMYGLNKLAANDSNKERIVDNKALPYYVKMMELSGNKKAQYEATRGVWLLGFKCKDVILKDKNCVKVLEKLASSSDDESVKREASGALWIIKDKSQEAAQKALSKIKTVPNRPASASSKRESIQRAMSYAEAQHVMISYNWKTKPVMLRVRDKLVKAGYKVWMDVNNMTGSLLEAMAKAVEDSAVVLVCVSQKYKESPSCRTEATYAYKLQKLIVPLKMQSDYNADSWLGILCGDKLYFDFSKEEKFENSISALMKEIGEKGKAVTDSTSSQDTPDGGEPLVHATTAHVTGATHGSLPAAHNADAENWTDKDVTSWLEKKSLGKYKKSFVGFNGKLLLELNETQHQAPEFFFARLHGLGMTLVDTMKFRMALKKL